MASEDRNFAGLLSAAHDLPPHDGPLRPYFLCSTPRTGSTLLSDALTRNGDFGVPAEYLHPDAISILGRRFGAFSPAGDRFDVAAFVRALVRSRTSRNGRFGIKCHFDQLRVVLGTTAVQGLLGQSQFIRIGRRDRLAQAVSFEIARQQDIWHVRSESADPPPTVVYDQQRLDVALRSISSLEAQWDLFFEANRIDPLTLWYEEIVADPASAGERVLAHLGAPSGARIDLASTGLRRVDSGEKKSWRARYLDGLRFRGLARSGSREA